MVARDIDIAIRARDEASAVLSQVTGNLTSMLDRLVGVAGLVAGSAAAVIGGRKLVRMSEEMAEAFIKQERATRGMNDAQQEFASNVQKQLGVGDEVVLRLMQQARLLGVNEEELNKVALAAIGMAEATGQGLQEVLRQFATNTETLNDNLESAARGIELKRQANEGLEGAMARSANSMGDLREKVGELIAPMLTVIHNGIGVFAEVAQNALVPAIDTVNGMLSVFGSIMQQVTEYVVGAVSAIQTAFSNLGVIIEIAMTTGELALTSFTASLQHSLAVNVPQILDWFSRNWLNIMEDLGQATLTIFQNMAVKVALVFATMWDYINSGFEGGVAGLGARVAAALEGSLLKGFKAKTESLPELIERGITNREAALAARLSMLGGKLGKSFTETFNQNMAILGGNLADLPGLSALDIADTGSAASALKATEGRLLTRGPADDPINKVVDNTKKTADEVKGLRGDMQRNPKLEVTLVQ